MKCSAKLQRGGSCGQEARFNVNGNPLCRRHASEAIFVTHLKDPANMNPVKLKEI